jgi:hypothetical protein
MKRQRPATGWDARDGVHGHKLVRVDTEHVVRNGVDEGWRWRWVCECGSRGQWNWQSDNVAKVAHRKHANRTTQGPRVLMDLLKLDYTED